MSLRHIDVIKPTKEEAKYILSLLDEEAKRYPNITHVVAQEYHPNGGYRKTIITLEVARDSYNQREHAPYVLWYAARNYYEKLLADT